MRLDIDALAGMLHFVEIDEELHEAWLARNRERLLARAATHFKNLREYVSSASFHFIDTDQVVFLRVHHPDLFGDRINQPTLNGAVESQQQMGGVEIGEMGDLVLRVVRPWRIDTKVVGYLELGRTIDHIAAAFSDDLDIELLFALDKSKISQSLWEAGRAASGLPKDWDRFPRHVISGNTLDAYPDGLEALLSSAIDALVDVTYGSAAYQAAAVPLRDAGGEVIGKIVMSRDVTAEDSLAGVLLPGMVIALLIIGPLFCAYLLYLARVNRKLSVTRAAIVGLLDREESLREFLKTSPYGFQHLDSELNYIDTYAGHGEAASGLTREEIIGRNLADVVPMALTSGRYEIYKEVIRTGKAHNFGELGPYPEWNGRIVEIQAFPLGTGVGSFTVDVTDRRNAQDALQSIVEGTASTTGAEFFPAMVQHLATSLHLRYAAVAEKVGTDGKSANILAIWMADHVAGPLNRDLFDTPCACVFDESRCVVPSGLQNRFPNDELLSELHADSFIGVALKDPDGAVFGHLCVLHDEPIENVDHVEKIVSVFAARAAAEILRMRATVALKEKEASLEEAQRIGSIGNYNWDIDSGAATWSDEMYRILGHEPHSVPAGWDTTLALVHPGDLERLIARQTNVDVGDGVNEIIFRIIRPDEELRVLRGMREIIHDADGKPLRGIGTLQDITQQQKQRELETRLGRILENLWEEIYVIDAETLRYLEVSRGARENLGYSMDELLEMTPVNIVPHGDQDKAADFVAPLRSGESETVEYVGVHRRRDGSRYKVEGQIQLSREETPNVIIAVFQDVTEKKKAEKKLQEQQEVLEELLHTRAQELGKTEQYLQSTMRQLEHQKYALDAHSIVAVTDLHGRITYANQKFTDLSGYNQEELLGKTHAIVNSGHHPRSFFAELWRTVLRGDVWKGQIKNRAKDGVLYWVDSTIVPLHGDDEKVSGFVAIRTDITERKEQEIALEIAKEAAEASSVAKSAFLANMSHEIRTPMNGVLGMAELLLGTDLTEVQRFQVDAILRSGESLIMIIDDVLDLSKVEAGKLLIAKEPFDLEKLTQQAAAVLAPQAAKKTLALIIRYAEDAPRHMLGDAARVRQILVNLIGNAIKFTSEGHVLIEVEVDRDFRSGSALRILVEDTGIGIKPDKLSHIFDAFTQADSTVTRKFGGTGLGLAISRQLVDMMEGTLEVESEVDRGTRFVVTIPFAIDESGAAPEPLPSEIEGRRILVIDPYERRRRIVVDQFLDFGLRCTALASGVHVLEELQSAAKGGDAYWGVVLDGATLDTTPDEMADALRSEDSAHCVFLMVLTEANNHLREAGRLDKVRQIQISKPVIPSDLSAALRSIVTGGDSGTRVAQEESPTDYASFTILLAEDNKVNQAVALGHLEKHRCHVDVAPNGLVAYEMALKRPYDLIFMDVQMPIMDGIAATVEIRKTGHSRRTPIVATTANAMEEDRKRCLDAGMDDYLSKPLRGNAIDSILDTYLGGVPAPEPAPAPSKNADPQGPTPIFDLQEALDTTDGDVILLRDLISIVDKDLPERLRELQVALDTHDEEAMLRVVHTIKSQAAHLGAPQLRAIAGEAESAALDRNFGHVHDLAPRIVASAEDLCEQLALIDWDALANGAKK